MSRDELSTGNGVDASVSNDAEVARVLDEYLAGLEAGRPADPGRLLAEHPAIASQLRACLQVMHLAGRVAGEPGSGAADGSDPNSGATAMPLAPSMRSTWNVGNGPPPRVRLHDLDDEEPLVRPRSPAMPTTPEGSWGRYQLQGEIARGGMGAVIKGRDTDLGRDLAIKVLLESHRGDSQIVRRFIEEAQIGGQLQHPGIVPVYELGTCADRRPYFAMKLVKGRTLALMLQARAVRAGSNPDPGRGSAGGASSPSRERERAVRPVPESAPLPDGRGSAGFPTHDDLPRFLAIFEQVCQTMAYAHARGVIHRDLKPSNIMVGSFGEVQVMDWGLAKVLARGGVADEAPGRPGAEPLAETVIMTVRTGPSGSGSDSQAGSVLGTPAYMAPEQARGDVERLDERVDVFGLGAILCEVLTGCPPFGGSTREEVRARAARGDLAEALGRLDSCGADAELVELAKDCLAAEPEHRPRDASEVARRMSVYQAGVQGRLKAAELARVEAHTRAEEERKRRRVTVALAASVLGLVVLGGGVWAYMVRQRAERARQVDRASSGLESLYAEAKRAGDDLTRWAAAREAAHALEGLLADAPDAVTRSRLTALVGDVAQQAAAADSDQQLLAKLFDIRSATGDDPDDTAKDARYTDAFREAGMDIAALPPARAGAEIQARPDGVRVAIVAVLDDWAALRRNVTGDQDGARRLTEIARLADPDPWRDRLRAVFEIASGRERLKMLKDLAGELQSRELPAVSLVHLGANLLGGGDVKTAEFVLREAERRYPGDVWVNVELARSLDRLSRREEAIRYYTAARALRPEAAHLLAHALEGNGETDQALAVFRDLTQLRPQDGGSLTCLGKLLKDRGRTDEAQGILDAAIVASRAAVEQRPGSCYAHALLGFALSAQGNRDEAIAEYREALRIKPEWPGVHVELGIALRESGKADDAIAECRTALRIKADFADAHDNLGNALRDQGKLDEAIAEFRAALRIKPDSAGAHSNLGNALRDQGKLDEAIAEFRAALRVKFDLAEAHTSLGNALCDQGKLEEAIAEHRAAIQLKPDLANAHSNLGGTLCLQGKLEDGIPEFRAALRIKPDYAEAHSNLGVALWNQGKWEQAITEFRAALRLKPDSAEAHSNLGNALRDQGKLEEAIAECRAAIRLKPDDAAAHDNLGLALRDQGKLGEAIAEHRAALRLEPNSALAHSNLGAALRSQGKYTEARAEFRKAHDLATKTNPRLARAIESNLTAIDQLASLAARLPAVLAGKTKAADVAEMLNFALLSYDMKLHGASARFWSDAFGAQPKLAEDMRAANRYNAACAAALAGCGQGKDDPPLDDATRTHWRKQAIDWLKADLVAWSRILESGPPQTRPVIAQTLQHWKADPDLAGFRDPAARSKLPEDEQKTCRALWDGVDALLKKARDAKP